MIINFPYQLELNLNRGEFICKQGEDIDFFGIIVHGQTFVCMEHQKIKTLEIGEMIGFMCLSELAGTKPEGGKHKYDIIAETDGIIALLPFGEIKSESRKNPQIVIISF